MPTALQLNNKDDRVQLKATLTDINGNPLANKLIKFYKSYGTSWELIDQKYTNEDGVAITTDETTKSCYYKARFDGDETYDASEDVKYYQVKEVTKPAPPSVPWWIILIILFMILLLAR